MSLYTHTEVCKGCIHSVFHNCCGNFCNCKINKDDEIDTYRGTCKSKEIEENK